MTTNITHQHASNCDVHNQILQGDATAHMGELPSQFIDLIITDAPYLIGYKDRSGRTIANDENPDGVLPAIPEMHRVLKGNRYAIIFCGWSAIDQFSAAWTKAGFRTVGGVDKFEPVSG